MQKLSVPTAAQIRQLFPQALAVTLVRLVRLAGAPPSEVCRTRLWDAHPADRAEHTSKASRRWVALIDGGVE